MNNNLLSLLHGDVLDEHTQLSLTELSELAKLPAETVVEFVNEGLIEPTGTEPSQWRFAAISVQRVRSARRLARDLRVNTAGAALALELLEEVRSLRETLRRFET